MEHPTHILVLHIPANGGDARIIDLYDNYPRDNYPTALDPITKDMEKDLKHFPDLQPFDNTKFLNARYLIDSYLCDPAAPPKWHGSYYMYKNFGNDREPGEKPSENPHFEKNAQVYGEVFVFRLRKGLRRRARARYEDMEGEFAENFNDGGWAKAFVKDLATENSSWQEAEGRSSCQDKQDTCE